MFYDEMYFQILKEIKKNKNPNNRLRFRNPFKVELFRNGKVIQTEHGFNDIVNEGKNRLLDVMFNDGTQIANNSWFIGLVDNGSFSAFANTDTLSSHAGWIEFTGYTGNRQAWGSGAASSQSTTNATPATFPITSSGTLKGVFIASVNTGTSGLLWATAAFTANIPVVNADELKITYTVSA